MAEKKKIAVLGAGTMGVGIAQTFAMAGHEVKLIYVYDDKTRSHPVETMTENLTILEEEGVLRGEEIATIIGRVSYTESLEEAAGFAQVIIECIVENLEVKRDFFQKLDALCPLSTILATNTSAISVTEIAEGAVHRERILGTHFWNPAYLIPLVEVINTKYADAAMLQETCTILCDAGKMPVVVKKDVPGFLANRMQHALFREAVSIVEHGIADAADVDRAIKYGFGMRLGVSGPMEVIDRGGTDLTYAIESYLFPHIESAAKPSGMLTELMNSGKLGFKTGEGFQTWSPEQVRKSNDGLTRGLIAVMRSLDRL